MSIKEESIKVASGRALLAFIEVTFNGVTEKFVNNPVTIGAYNASNFKFTNPHRENNEFSTRLVIDNIDRTITSKIRQTLAEKVPIKLWYAFSDTPNTYEIGAWDLIIKEANITAQTITLSVYKPSILPYQLTGYTMNTKDFPGLGYA